MSFDAEILADANNAAMDAFSVPVVYSDGDGLDIQIDAVFDDDFQLAGIALTPDVESYDATFTIRTDDVSDAAVGHTIQHAGTCFEVAGPPEHDAFGFTVLRVVKR